MASCTTIRAIFRREFKVYFDSPVAYVFIVIFLLLTGFFTFMMGGFFRFKEATLTSFFVWHPWLYMLLVPAVGMRLWSEERRQGTLELLFTMPVNTAAAIAGKFLAGWIFLGFALLLTLPMPITVCWRSGPPTAPSTCLRSSRTTVRMTLAPGRRSPRHVPGPQVGWR